MPNYFKLNGGLNFASAHKGNMIGYGISIVLIIILLILAIVFGILWQRCKKKKS